MSSRLSRRSLLKASAGLIGASALTGRLVSPAFAGPVDKSAVVLVFLDGGYNALFSSADSFLGNNTFGVTSSNIINAGSGLFVDSSTFGTLAPDVLAHTAAIGINHGQSGHDTATGILWGGTRGRAQVLAGAIGGSAAIKCAVMGGDLPPGSQDAVAGVSMQQILDTGTTLSALGANSDPTLPDRAIAAGVLEQSQALSSGLAAANPFSLRSLADGYQAAIDTLKAPIQQINAPAIASAYGLAAPNVAVDTFGAKLFAAELMILAGCNVVIVVDESGWDTHGDSDGSAVRSQMSQLMSPMATFLSRSLALPGYNVSTAMFGDFARDLPGSDHADCTSATVWGRNVTRGTTGRVSAGVSLPMGCPSVDGFWAYLAATAKVPVATEFGPNPHALVL